MIEIPQDYYEVKGLWHQDGKLKGLPRKAAYGDHRKKILYINLLVRRLICPDLTPTDMLYDLCYEMDRNIDNTNKSHFITKSQLISIVEYAYSADLSKFNYKRPRNRKVNQAYVNKTGKTKRQVAAECNAQKHHEKKVELWEKIGELYDCSKKLKENLQILKENGIEISEKTLKRFKSENGLTKKRNKMETQNATEATLIEPEQTFTQEVVSCSDEELEAKRKWFITPHSRLENLDWNNIGCDKEINKNFLIPMNIDMSAGMTSHSLLNGIDELLADYDNNRKMKIAI